jgi:Leucine-rich repeat (LRR) protein
MPVFGKWRPFFSFHEMRLLRVLDLEDTSDLVDHHLEHIGKLIHLRYLSLRRCGDIYHLPDSLGNLRQLETLDVKGTRIIKLPKTINKLTKLHHVLAGHVGPDDDDICEPISQGLPKLTRNKLGLVTVFSAGFCVACCAPHCMKQKMDMDGDVNRHDVCTVCCCAMLPALATRGSTGGVAVPRDISKLKALLTLGTVNVSGRRKNALQDIKGFSRLRKLGVAGINRSNGKELCSAISHLRCLESLSVYSDGKHGLLGCLDDIVPPPENLQSLKLYGRLGRLPDWIHRLNNLVKLKLQSSQLCEDNATAMEVLGSLPNLAILILLQNSFEGEELYLTFRSCLFPSLLVLQIQSLHVVLRVEFEPAATPKLEVLRLSSHGDCRFYGLQHLPSIREVVLSKADRGVREQLAQNQNRPVLKIIN